MSKYRIINSKTGKIIVTNESIEYISQIKAHVYTGAIYIVQKNTENMYCQGCSVNLDSQTDKHLPYSCKCGNYKCKPIRKEKWSRINWED